MARQIDQYGIGYDDGTPEVPIRTLDNRSPSTRTLEGLGAGESLNFQRPSDSLTIFNNALMEMLKQAQKGTGTLQSRQATLDLSTEQAQRGMEQATPGMSPGQQQLVRSASMGALSPSIKGAEDTTQTLSERLSGFKDILNQTRLMGSELQDAQYKAQENTRKMVETAITQFGSAAFEGVNENEIKSLEKSAGYPSGYLMRTAKSLKEKELASKVKSWSEPYKLGGDFVQKNLATGEIRTAVNVDKGGGGVDAELSVDSWVKLIQNGQANLTNIKTQQTRDKVAVALANSGQLILSDKDREKLSTLDTAFNVANTIKYLSSKINTFDERGRITGYAERTTGGLLQTNTDIARYNAAREGFVSNVARTLGEKGTLAEGDVQRAMANLPTIHDTKAVAEAKLQTLFSILEGAKNSIIQKSTQPISKISEGTLNQNNDPMGIR